MKKIMLLLAAVMTAFAANAQLLWKVSGNGLERPSYLFGTHHFAPSGLLDKLSGFHDALASVDEVAGEMDMLHLSAADTRAAMMGRAVAPPDSTLDKMLSPQQVDSLNVMLADLTDGTINAAYFNALRPAMVYLTMTQFIMAKLPPDTTYSAGEQLDTQVQVLGDSLGKRIHGLETIDQQMEMLLGAPMQEQAEELMAMVRDNDGEIEKMKRLTEAYLTQDIDVIDKMFLDPETMSPAMRERLLDRRNKAWTDYLRAHIADTPVLMAVGVGHLVGEGGLIALLRNAGYTVTPVN